MIIAETNKVKVYVDSVLTVKLNNETIPIIWSVYDRSNVSVRGFTSVIGGKDILLSSSDGSRKKRIVHRGKYDTHIAEISSHFEQATHAMSIHEYVGIKYLVTSKEMYLKDIYTYLKNSYRFPLLESWVPYIINSTNNIRLLESEIIGNEVSAINDMGNKSIYYCNLEEDELREIISNGLKHKNIILANKPQKKLEFKNMDEYFMKYGDSIVENLKKKIKPLSETKNTVDEIALINKRLFPKQANIVNGISGAFKHRSYIIMNEDMGCGKVRRCGVIGECA